MGQILRNTLVWKIEYLKCACNKKFGQCLQRNTLTSSRCVRLSAAALRTFSSIEVWLCGVRIPSMCKCYRQTVKWAVTKDSFLPSSTTFVTCRSLLMGSSDTSLCSIFLELTFPDISSKFKLSYSYEFLTISYCNNFKHNIQYTNTFDQYCYHTIDLLAFSNNRLPK